MGSDFKAVVAYGVTCLIVFALGMIWHWTGPRVVKWWTGSTSTIDDWHICSCGAPCEEKFNSGDPAWVCTECRKIQNRRY